MALSNTGAYLRQCNVLDFSMSSPNFESAIFEGEGRLELKTNFRILSGEGGLRDLRCTLSVKALEGVYYSIEMSAVASFEFPSSASDEDIEEYLKTVGSVRVYDFARNALESMTVAGIFGTASIPPTLRGLNEENFDNAIQIIKSADLGITGSQLAVSDLTEEERAGQKVVTDKVKVIFEALVGKELEDFLSPGKKITLQFQHLIAGRKIGFGFEDESLGTVTILNLAADFLDAIVHGRVLVLDEIERSLHPVLLHSLISLFFDRNLNKSNAQLIFTTHDLSVMDSEIMRRDQIWFVDKDCEKGTSDLYSLAEYSPRKDDDILNRYLYGAYGAVPFIEEAL